MSNFFCNAVVVNYIDSLKERRVLVLLFRVYTRLSVHVVSYACVYKGGYVLVANTKSTTEYNLTQEL